MAASSAATLRSVERGVIHGFPAAVVALAASAALRAYGAPIAVVFVVAALVFAGAAFLLIRAGDDAQGADVPRRWVLIASAVLALLTIVQSWRLSDFVAEPSHVASSMRPSSPFMVHHNCATAYFVAPGIVKDDPASNVYEPSHYYDHGKPRDLEGFALDAYEYPPTFLLVGDVVRLFAPSPFLRFRAMWFFLSTAALVATLALSIRWLRGTEARTAALLIPLLWLTLPWLTTWQIGNFHPVMLTVALAAMVAIDRRHVALGGALLAFVIAAKISPGVLVVYLAVRRDWRAVAWTAGAGAVLVVLSIVAHGVHPWATFLAYQMPRLDSGLAFPQLTNMIPGSVAVNQGIPGLVFKLRFLGLGAASPLVVRAAGWGFTALVIALAVLAARRPLPTRWSRAVVWTALLALASLRSVFLGAYATLGPLLVLLLLASAPGQSWKRLAALAAAALALDVGVAYTTPDSVRALGVGGVMAISTAMQALCVAASIFGLVVAGRTKGDDAEERGAPDADAAVADARAAE